MTDIFLSYESSDRPRAETLRTWFEDCGWSVWIDREIDIGEPWEKRIAGELRAARLVVVLWGAQARRSEWVRREASEALRDRRILQIHATGLPLLPPFDSLQAVRMQSWSGEAAHSERTRLLLAVAERLGADVETVRRIEEIEAALPTLNFDAIDIIQLALEYCARQVELRRKMRGAAPLSADDFSPMGDAFTALLDKLNVDCTMRADDRDGLLHRMVGDFLNELELLAPAPGRIL